MTEKEAKKEIASIRRTAEKIRRGGKKSILDFLIKAGILTKSGKLKKKFRNEKE